MEEGGPKLQGTLFNFPPWKREAKSEAVLPEKPEKTVPRREEEEKKPVVARFPRSQPEIPSLKLEAEGSEQSTNPIVLWQVYAIGGFFILRWALARWKERKPKKKSSDGEPSAAEE
ncbi:hypothetical protein NMG60_11018719 [Bertholletia excelsa]